MDTYTKTILTIIALLLAAHLFKPIFTPAPAEADRIERVQVVNSLLFPVNVRVIP